MLPGARKLCLPTRAAVTGYTAFWRVACRCRRPRGMRVRGLMQVNEIISGTGNIHVLAGSFILQSEGCSHE